jgi:cell division protein FtsB
MRSWSKKRRGAGFTLLRTAGGVAVIVILALLAAVSARAAWNMYEKFTEASLGRQAAQSELDELKEKKERVSTAVTAFSSERGIEAEIRQRFGVAKPGEGEIQIVRDEDGEGGASKEPQNLWEWIVETFFVW